MGNSADHMKFNISKEVLEETTKCPNDFSCLFSGQTENSVECKAQWAVSRNMLFVQSDKLLDCPYKIPFGDGQFCTCPTRFSIYKKYRQ